MMTLYLIITLNMSSAYTNEFAFSYYLTYSKRTIKVNNPILLFKPYYYFFCSLNISLAKCFFPALDYGTCL